MFSLKIPNKKPSKMADAVHSWLLSIGQLDGLHDHAEQHRQRRGDVVHTGENHLKTLRFLNKKKGNKTQEMSKNHAKKKKKHRCSASKPGVITCNLLVPLATKRCVPRVIYVISTTHLIQNIAMKHRRSEIPYTHLQRPRNDNMGPSRMRFKTQINHHGQVGSHFSKCLIGIVLHQVFHILLFSQVFRIISDQELL